MEKIFTLNDLRNLVKEEETLLNKNKQEYPRNHVFSNILGYSRALSVRSTQFGKVAFVLN